MSTQAQPFTQGNWNTAIRSLPEAHILQSAEWGAFKQITGWQAARFTAHRNGQLTAAIQVLVRRLGPFAVMYAPKGPMCAEADLESWGVILAAIENMARRTPTLQLKIDTDVAEATGEPGSEEDAPHQPGQAIMALLRQRGWRPSVEQVQFRNTITVDLTKSTEALLATMNQSKRRKVHYGLKHGLNVRTGTLKDLPMLYTLYEETGNRNQFIIRPKEYYLQEWGDLMRAGLAHALIAEWDGRPVAHVILYHFGSKCLYFTGASISDPEARRLMPADMLQWEAIQWAKKQGYRVYDMWGAPTTFDESDSMWGVYQFKKDYGGTLVRHLGAWDYAPYPILYRLYTKVMPGLLAAMKRRAK
jgi:peptidoglycan pentaglycine glycine transferase (the first glycine)